MNQAALFPDENIIKLCREDVEFAIDIGVKRNLYCLYNNHVREYEDSWTRNIEGAFGEMVVAKRLGLEWAAEITDFKKRDVGPYEVRARVYNPKGFGMDLGVKPTDGDGKPFILVVCKCPVFHVRGWIMSHDAKRPEWLNENGFKKVFYVPRKALKPMSELPTPDELAHLAP